jgi:hypothetical protein
MKHLFTAILLFCSLSVFAQVPPQAFNYSGVARNPQGNPIASGTIAVQISILKGSTSGALQYRENHTVTTDHFGLFNLIIGAGAVQSGSMNGINWGIDNYYLQIGLDLNGGTNFILMGISQLLSVPYALHAGSAAAISGGGGFTHYIGEYFGGGVIFHLYRDSLGAERGLIVGLNELSSGIAWDSSTACLTGGCINIRYAESTWNGATNTAAILSELGTTATAASLCDNYSAGGFTDWYMPALQELHKLWTNLLDVNRTMEGISGAQIMRFAVYWSSTEVDGPGAWNYSFMTGGASYWDKYSTYNVRAIRSF